MFSLVPCCVAKATTLKTFHDERILKSSFAIFQIQYPNSQQAKVNGRGQQPFPNDRKERVRELMVALAPPQVAVPSTAPNVVLHRALSNVSQYGVSPTFVGNGIIERHGLPTIRYHVKGTREVWILGYTHIQSFFIALAKKSVDGFEPVPKNVDMIKGFCSTITMGPL